jgi:hypothetical protein
VRRLLTPGWLARHGLAIALVAAFLTLGWWQISRAAGGNALSWAYAVEWPVFAGFVVFVWWREVRRERRGDRPGRPRSGEAAAEQASAAGFRRPVVTTKAYAGSGPETAGAPDGDLAAYNDYLAWLNANPGARPGDYPAANRKGT